MNTIDIFKARTKARRVISDFLEVHGYTEVDTPLLSPSAIPEPTIKLFKTSRHTLKGNDTFYLLPSPELYMKRILSETKTSIYQFSKCFRNSEQAGKEHLNEFTMLEYYAVNKNEEYSLKITEELLKLLSTTFDSPILKKDIIEVSMRTLVMDTTGLDLNKLQNKSDLQKAIENYGITIWNKSESWDDSFNRLFVSSVEPKLTEFDAPVAIYDYPKQIECLSENSKDGMYKKRWELYINGIELANCYREETNPDVIASYFKNEHEKILKDESDFKSDFDLVNYPLPQSSGVALGFDRLMMCLLKKSQICDIMPNAKEIL